MRRIALLALALFAPAAARAEVQLFEMRLAGTALGTLAYDSTEAGAGWTTDLDNTPLGVADGVFTATSVPVAAPTGEAALRYQGVTESARRDRVIEVIHADGRVLSVAVAPDSEVTNLSVAERVPEGVIDPVQAFARLLDAEGCPAPFRIYDGRRVVDVTPQGSGTEDGQLVCELDYRVVAGPGHLAPLGISTLTIRLRYDQPEGGPQVLRRMDVRAGLLGLRVVR